jgi:hypothetical protein
VAGRRQSRRGGAVALAVPVSGAKVGERFYSGARVTGLRAARRSTPKPPDAAPGAAPNRSEAMKNATT